MPTEGEGKMWVCDGGEDTRWWEGRHGCVLDCSRSAVIFLSFLFSYCLRTRRKKEATARARRAGRAGRAGIKMTPNMYKPRKRT